MSKTTRATQALSQNKITFSTVTYDYDPGADRIGLQAAEAIGEPPHRVLKTLMAELDGKPDVALTAGMPVEVAIQTGERRAGDYLLEPILRHLRKAMRDE